jgi:hypothetical protein
MAATEIMAVPGKVIAVAIFMAIAAWSAGKAIVLRAAIRAMTLRATSTIVVTVAVAAVAVVLLPWLSMMIARAVSPGNRRNQ